MVDVAKDETRSVASETKQQARQFLGKVGDELRGQAAAQQSKVAEGLQSVGSEFTDMASGSTQSGYASQLVRGAGERVGDAARWLQDRDPQSLVEEVKGFARRRPGVFIAIAVGVGVVAGRLTRAITASGDSSGTGASTSGRSSVAGGTGANARTGRLSDDAGFSARPVPPTPEMSPPRATTVGAAGSAPTVGGA
ncbi:hypothetical protein DCE93_05455 [Agromyces badenianii]|uniref:Uncharacterized protein n=1 Tax=Agromyces badenianii TaxID=2080742 RepID=A0A2S0WV41_9MICO|nr:hypothetical protein DCE93_05455 [Agromyces badenianii]PWC03247.1 hypothetical protein DCE94_13440 [Agromyces badenianii]